MTIREAIENVLWSDAFHGWEIDERPDAILLSRKGWSGTAIIRFEED